VGDDHQRDARSAQRDDALHQLPPRLRVETGGRLVEHEHLRLQRQHAGERGAAHLPAAQPEGDAVLELRKGQAHRVHRLAHPLAHLLAAEAQLARAVGHVVAHILLEELRLRHLEDQPDPPPDRTHVDAGRGQILVEDHHLAAVGAQQPVEMLDRRGLPRPRVADDAHDLPALHGQVDVEERLHRQRRPAHVEVGEVGDGDDRRGEGRGARGEIIRTPSVSKGLRG
jgi:hypothetical protein